MLHIILLILKIIGWILLAILGLFVLLVCVTLFFPLCYSGEGVCKGNLESLYAKFKFSWLFHLISGKVLYRDGKLEWGIRIAWKKLNSEEDVVWEDSHEVNHEVDNQDERIKKIEAKKPAEIEEQVPSQKRDESVKQVEDVKKEAPERKKFFEKISAWFEWILQRIKTIREKIKYTFDKICDTIKSMLEKKDKLAAFITDEIHKSALAAALKEIHRILKFLKPKKLKADIHFGFEDPSITGYVLALSSMIYPFIGEHTDIQPDFEHKILEGNVIIAGKIRMLYFAISAWNLIWNKHVRTTFKHIRKFKL